MIVITGASDGLGLELAKLYQTEGKTVVNVSRRKCDHASINLLHDLQKADEVAVAADEIKGQQEPLEALINCAGVMSIEPLGEITATEIDRTMAINVMAPILLVSNLIERIRRDGSDIVNVSSAIAVKGKTNSIVYGTSKWALRGFSANLDADLRSTPSRVISFCPGGFQTKIYEKVAGENNDDKKGAMMSVADVALNLKQILDLPKSMQATEIILDRKK